MNDRQKIEVVISGTEAEFPVKEAYKSLRTNIQFCGKEKQIIAFTSSMSGEGKSTVSMNLAIVFAEMGNSVLYIDADLRRSVMMNRLRTREEHIKGLSHFLSGQYSFEEVIYATNIEHLSLVAAGPVPPDSVTLLGNGLLKEGLEQQRKKFDYIIIDTPPIGSVIDAAVAAPYCDGIVIVLEENRVGRRMAQNIKKQLEKTGCPILGVVVNKVGSGRKGRLSKYYYNYYYGNNLHHYKSNIGKKI